MAICKVPISDLPVSHSLDGSELIPVVEGTFTKQSALSELSGFVNLQYVLNITFKSQVLPFDKGNQNASKYLLSTTIFKNFSAKNAAIIGRFFHIFKDFWPFLIEISS